MSSTLFFLAQTAGEETVPWWIALIVAIFSGVAVTIKKYRNLSTKKVPTNTSLFDTIVYLLGQDSVLSSIDEEAIKELNESAEKNLLTFDEYVKALKSLSSVKAYTYITSLPEVKAVTSTTGNLLDEVSTVVTNMIESKYDEEDLKELYQSFVNIFNKKE